MKKTSFATASKTSLATRERFSISLLPALVMLLILISGCHHSKSPAASSTTGDKSPPAQASHGPQAQDPRETAILSDVVQLTSGFDRAGEAYFSPDSRYII